MFTKKMRGFTLVEVLVVLAIIGVILGLLIPGVQGMREMARRSSCQQNLMELSQAIAAYHVAKAHYPIGTVNPTGPILSIESGLHHDWVAGLLPYLDAQVIAERIDASVSVYDPANAVPRAASFPFLLCPSATAVLNNTTCYAGIHHSTEAPIDESNDGVFVLNIPTRDRDITDGLSYTLFLGEKVSDPSFDLGWISGTRSSLRNTGHAINALSGAWPNRIAATLALQDDEYSMTDDEFSDEDMLDADAETAPPTPPEPIVEAEIKAIDPLNPMFVGGLQSDHPGGAHTLNGAGEITFRSSSMDGRLMRQLANKADGEIPTSVMDELTLPAEPSQ